LFHDYDRAWRICADLTYSSTGSHDQGGGIGGIAGGVPCHRHHGKIGQVADRSIEDAADFCPGAPAAHCDASRRGQEAMARAPAGAGLAIAGDYHCDPLVVARVDRDAGDVALDLDPTGFGFRLNYALALCRLNRWQDGVVELREVFATRPLDPDNGDAAKALYIAREQAKTRPGDVRKHP
jgi:hypothetical protein